MPDKKADKIPKKPAKKSHLALIITLIIIPVFILILLGGVLAIFALALYAPRSDVPTYVSVIKDQSAELDVAKQVGDTITAGQPTAYGFTDVANTAILAETTISANYPPAVLNYATAVYKWGAQIQTSAGNTNWSNLPDAPESFKLSLTAIDTSDTYDDTLAGIDHDKTFGDYAIAKNNRVTMRWIAARLHAEEIYLDALSHSAVAQHQANVAYAATTYGPQCHYGRGRTLFYSDRTQKGACAKKLADGVKPLRQAAQNYSRYARAQDAQDWQTAVKGLQTLGYPITTTGASVDTSGQPTPPPAIQAFRDSCAAKNGTTPSGATKAGLPTTESGQTCAYKGPKGGFCWDFQTDSGNSYSGGDPDCQRRGLLPTVAMRNNQPAQNNNQQRWPKFNNFL